MVVLGRKKRKRCGGAQTNEEVPTGTIAYIKSI